MEDKRINPDTITGKINQKALEIIASSKDGVRWVDLSKQLLDFFPDFHPKTINGCVWKLVEKFPDRVEKPEKGLFRSLKK